MELLLAQRLLDLSTSARTRIKQVLLTRLSHKNNKARGLVRQEAADCLQTLLAPVHVVSQEEVVRLQDKALMLSSDLIPTHRLWWEATTFEQLQQVRIPATMPTHVTAVYRNDFVEGMSPWLHGCSCMHQL